MKYLVIAFFFVTIFTNCNQINGSGKIITEKRTVGAFTGIKVGGAFEVEATITSTTSVTVEADDNIAPLIQTYVSDGILYIKTKMANNLNNGHMKILISTPLLSSIDCSGAANLKVINAINHNGKIKLEASGASDIEATINAPEVLVEASGAGQIELNGNTQKYTLLISGASDVKSSNLLSENTDVHVSGAGNAYVHSSLFLKAVSSGAGTIHYRGAGRVDEHVSGAGTIVKDL
jgi:hypothetical protein